MKQSTFSAVMANNIQNLWQRYSQSLRLLLVMLLTLTASTAWGADGDIAYTLSCVKNTSNSAYATYYDVTINSKKWTAPGNQTLGAYWRIGGKSLSNTIRNITGKNTIDKPIKKITISHNGKSNINLTVNSFSVTVSTDANFSNIIETKTITSPSVSSAGSFDLTPTNSVWESGCYYKFSIVLTNSKSSNYGLDLTSIVFYEGSVAPDCIAPTITTQPSAATYTKGATATALKVVASGDDLTYQWYSNTSNNTSGATIINGATNSTYTPSTSTVGTKYYYCIVSSGSCSTTSNIVSVVVKNPPFTVTLVPGSGSVTSTTLTESSSSAGVTLPTPTLNGCDEWTFAGWKTTSAVATETTTKPTLIAAGTYKPTANTTLYAVYQKTETTEGTPTTTNKTYTHTITAKTWSANGAQTLNSFSWTLDNNGGYYGYDSTKGQQVGSSGSPAKSMTLTTNGFANATNITAVRISTSGASSISGNVSVKVGSIAYTSGGSTTKSLTSTNTQYEFTGSSTGNVTISWSQTSSKAIYFKTIEVDYQITTGGGSTTTTYYHSTPDCSTPTPILSADVTKLDFGEVAVGESVTKTFKLTASNITDPTTLSISGVSNGFSVTPFGIDNTGDFDMEITVTYAPNSTGEHTQNIVIESSGAESVTIPLSGIGVESCAKVTIEKNPTSPGGFSLSINQEAVTSPVDNCNSGDLIITIVPYAGYVITDVTNEKSSTIDAYGTATVTYPKNNSITSIVTLAAKEYSVTLHTNGGTINSGNVESYMYGEGATLPTDVTKDGYDFAGWYELDSFYGDAVTAIGSSEAGSKEYWAKWNKKVYHTVIWKVNGETLISGGGNVFQTEVESGTTIYDLPNEPEAPAGCSGKVFVGWTTEAIDSETDTPPSKLYKVSSEFPVVTENVTYYAVWADEEGGGSEGWVLTDIANIDSDDVVVIAMTKSGTTWAMTNGNGTSNPPTAPILTVDGNKLSSIIAESIKWNISNSSGNLTIYPNGTTETWLYCNSTNNGVRVGTSDNKIFTIEGNYLKNTATSRYVGVYATNPDWRCYTSTSNNIADQTLGFYTYQSSTRYTAYITICDNTKAMVTYDLNDGTGESCESQKVTKGVEFTLCNQTPTKTGYNFAGWSYGTKTYAAGATVTVDDNTTFYASWTAKNITITWDQNYTDCPEATTSNYIYDGEEIAMPTDPTRVGYKFTGWFTAPTDGTQVTEVGETNKPTADVTYYAHWAELYTVTFMASGQVYAKQEFKYLSDETLQLPADPSAANYACDGYIFDGWSVTEKPIEEATKPTLISTPAITNDVTYYAVWKKATAEGAGEEIFYESFDKYDSPGGNDSNFKTASSQDDDDLSKGDHSGWIGNKVYGASKCIKLGGGSAKGYITTPALSQLSGNATLSFKAAAWNGSDEKTTLRLSIEGDGSLSQTSVTLKKGAWQTYELTITGGTSNTKIKFEGFQASDSRFFLDEVKVATSGSYNYTTSPSCGPTIVAKEGMWVTSTNAQSVKVNVPIAVKSFENNATITGTTANENFVVTPLENVGNGEHNVVVTYTPNAYNNKEDATITLTAKVGEETISTTTFTLNGRSLPEAFAVVVDKASAYFALPANMPEAGVYTGFNVTLNADMSAVVAAPKTHLYALKTVHKNRFDENGTCVRLEGNNTACLWATNAANGTHIRNWAQLNNADGAQYEWSLYTEDGDRYSISCAAVTEEGRILRMYGDNFGMYKSGANVFRLLPVECTEQPTNVQVSAARVTATIAWTNVASCDVKVYLKSNASLVKTLSGVASPVTVTELAETTEYTYTITPVGNVACEVSGEFKTTGPDIDIVEWMTDGIIIQVDKDESVNPKVVIKGEVEHNTGSGVMATELFFSKYFEAHGENKLLAIYNGTGAPIDLNGYEIKSENGTLDLSQFGQTKGTVAPNEEIILVYYDVTDDNKDNIPDHSAEPCAQEQEGYEKWHKLANKSVLAFSGRGSIGLYKDDVLIDVIGSTFPTGTLTKIGKSVNGNECEPEDVQLYVGGVSVNDQSSFFCTNGDNIKTAEVETNYAISTNRCLLIRKNTVTSGADAVATNKAEAGATCDKLSSTFKTLCSEWAGFRIGSGNSNDDEVKEATCDGLGYVGGFDYNKYYREFQTLDDSQTLDDFKYKPEENLYKLRIDNVAQYSCLNIQVQINDPVNGTVLTEQTAQVPILVTEANTTTDGLFSNIIDGDLDASKTRCSTCDVVVLDGATLTKAAAETDNDVNQVRNVYVYPGGQLIVPETGNDYKVNSVSFRRVEDAVANAQLSSNLNITASSDKPVYVDVRVNAENWHWFTLPYDCNIADVTWVDGTPAKYGVDWFLSTYDGEKRAATQSGGCWAEYHGETIKAGVGYIVGIAGHPTKSKVKYELRFPMSKEVLAQEVAGTDKTVPVNAWGVDEDMRPTHKGWNLVGNPYLDFYQKNKLNSFGGLRLGGKYVLNQSTGYWEDSGEWNEIEQNLPYVVVPINGGWSAYDQVLVSSIDLLPFTAYFVQVGNPETEDNGDLKDVLFDGDNRGRASIARRAPSSVSEQEEPVIVGVSLSNSKGESDMTSLVIDDKYTDEYEMNADFFKWFGDYYRYYTKPVLYTIGADKQQRAFNALNEEQAAKPVSMGTYTAQNGEYTFSLDRRSDLSRVKEVWLHDATESAYVNLMQEDYSFSTGKTDGTGRFTLAVTLHPKSPTDITEGRDGQVYVTSHQRTLYVNNLPQQARVWVYDAVGKLLVNETTNVYQRAYHLGQAGVYFVRVQSQNGCETLQAVVE